MEGQVRGVDPKLTPELWEIIGKPLKMEDIVDDGDKKDGDEDSKRSDLKVKVQNKG